MDLIEHGVGPNRWVGRGANSVKDELGIGVGGICMSPVLVAWERAGCKSKTVDGVLNGRSWCKVIGEGSVVEKFLSKLLSKQEGQTGWE